jgi:amidase
MTMPDFAEHDGLALASLVKKKEVTPLELVEACLERIERHNAQLNAVVHVAAEEARRVAQGPLPDGPFAGVPFLIKDLGLKVRGWPRTSGSHYAAVASDDHDSELVRRYRASGVVLIGKTNTPEFGIPGVTHSEKLGACRNPWNLDHVSGGSSGGAAAATAAGIVPLAHASDGLGSIRIPAACCGLVGLKTTRDRNPYDADDALRAIGLTVDHVVSRTVRDSAAMLDATGYPQHNIPYAPAPKDGPYLAEVGRSPGRLKIAWSGATPSGRPFDPETRACLEKTVDLLARLGHDVRERDFDLDWRQFYRAQGMVSAANFAAIMQRWIEKLGREPGDGEIGPLARRGWEAGKQVSGEQAFWAWQQLGLMSRTILSLWDDHDVYLCPVLGHVAPRVDHVDPLNVDLKEYDRRSSTAFPFTPPFNITGQPSLSLPLWQSQTGLPLAMMFTGRYGDEATLFRLAGQLEKEAPWTDRRPPVWN